MERLTIREKCGQHSHVHLRGGKAPQDITPCEAVIITNNLAAYEDLNLTPVEIADKLARLEALEADLQRMKESEYITSTFYRRYVHGEYKE